ncbi:MAG: hypothetical protein M0Z65_02985, partial [Firmicutes bacterium]|nr:hypothetical protein [Bacillota bacterium]
RSTQGGSVWDGVFQVRSVQRLKQENNTASTLNGGFCKRGEFTQIYGLEFVVCNRITGIFE